MNRFHQQNLNTHHMPLSYYRGYFMLLLAFSGSNNSSVPINAMAYNYYLFN